MNLPMHVVLSLLVAALTATSCAAVPPPEYPRTHPANPDADAAAADATPGPLSSYRPAAAPFDGSAPTETGERHEHH